MKKKGQVSFASAPVMVMSLVLMGLVAAAGIIALVAFKSTNSTDATANTSIGYAITGISNFTAQLGTVGTMIGVGLILVVILGVFGMAAFGRGRGGL